MRCVGGVWWRFSVYHVCGVYSVPLRYVVYVVCGLCLYVLCMNCVCCICVMFYMFGTGVLCVSVCVL